MKSTGSVVRQSTNLSETFQEESSPIGTVTHVVFISRCLAFGPANNTLVISQPRRIRL